MTTMTDERNAREQLEAAADWLGWQDENLSFGLKSAEDGLKLWKHWQANPDLPEMADEEIDHRGTVAKQRRKALGYDPLVLAEKKLAEIGAPIFGI